MATRFKMTDEMLANQNKLVKSMVKIMGLPPTSNQLNVFYSDNTKEEKQMRYESGDKAKCIYNSEGGFDVTVGKIYQVVNSYEYGGLIDIVNDKKLIDTYHQSHFEKVEDEKQMTLSDLKDMMVVETREDIKYLVFRGWGYTLDDGGIEIDKEHYTEDLKDVDEDEDFDIMKIYEINTDEAGDIEEMFKSVKLIWERKEVVAELTIEQIQEKLGYKIKIIESK